jgi:hypothetical protein
MSLTDIRVRHTQAASDPAPLTSHARNVSQDSSDWSVISSSMSHMSINSDNVAPTHDGGGRTGGSSSMTAAQSLGPVLSGNFPGQGHDHQFNVRNSQQGGPNYGSQISPTQYDNRLAQYPPQLDFQQSSPNQLHYTGQPTSQQEQRQYGVSQGHQDHLGYQATSYGTQTQNPTQSSHDTPVQSFQNHYQNQALINSQQPTDAQRLQLVGRNVTLEPGERSLPRDLQNRGINHRMMLRGTNGDREPLDRSK